MKQHKIKHIILESGLPRAESRGFTLIEVLVATSLFVVIIGIAVGIFVNSLRSENTIVALMAANDNASLTLEQMAREIRFSSQFSLSDDRNSLSFTEKGVGRVVYKFDPDGQFVERNGERLTARNVIVDYLIFELRGQNAGDSEATRVNIRLGVKAIDKTFTDSTTDLQTTVVSRQLDS